MLLKTLLAIIVIVAAAIFVGRLLFPLPDISQRPQSLALPPSPDSELAQLVKAGQEANPGKSGVAALASGHDALAGRLALAAIAQKSIDVQYYIWHDDTSGRLLLKALSDAAKRGVRVRLLVDDNGVPGLDATLATLDKMPNFEVRIFNPSTIRSPKLAGFAIDFFRMNRRMHNKSFVADGVAAIIGRRNVGNEYFQVGRDTYYLDLDVLAVGQAAADVSAGFDLYWNSQSVYEASLIVDPALANEQVFEAGLTEAMKRPEAVALREPMLTALGAAVRGEHLMEWTKVQLISDDPAKGLGKERDDQRMISRLAAILTGIEGNLEVISAYFIPGRLGTDRFVELGKKGIAVSILTNALDTTDVLPVHAGYAKYRKDLLEGGVKLYELKPVAGATDDKDELGPIGSSGASLHAKTFAIDRKQIFIGSFNFDPRSVMLNCEMGFLIDSPTLATLVAQGFQAEAAKNAYTVALNADGKMTWTETGADGKPIVHDTEPGATLPRRIAIKIIGWLPVEWLL